MPSGNDSLSNVCSAPVAFWGADGLLINDQVIQGSALLFLHATGLMPVAVVAPPAPAIDANGVIHLGLPTNGMVYDPGRNLLWASVPGNSPFAGNSVVSIDPATGGVVDSINAGSEPGALAISADGSHLFAALGGAPAVASVDLVSKQSSTFSVMDSSGSLYWEPTSVQAIDGQSNSVVVDRIADLSTSVTAYDAGVPRKNAFVNGMGGNMYAQFVQLIFPADAPNAFYAADVEEYNADGTHDIYRLVVDSTGIRLDTQLNSLPLGSGVAQTLTYDAGRILTSTGQIFTADTTRLLGSVSLSPANGLPIPYSDQNALMFVQSDSPNITANLYDPGTLRPLMAALLFTGQSCNCTTPGPATVSPTLAVRAGNSIAIVINGQIVIAPKSSFQPWPSDSGSVQTISIGVEELSVPVNAMSVLPGTSKLLLAVPGVAGSIGNSIVTFDTDAQKIESSAFIGSEPSILAPAPDGSSVYAYLSGETNVARLNVATGSRDLVFAADPAGGTNQFTIFDMAVGPDGGLAVSLSGTVAGGGAVEPINADGTIAVFDKGVLRPLVDSNSQGPYAHDPSTFALAFNDSGSTLYAFNSFLDTFELKREAVSTQGVSWLSSTSGLVGGFDTTIQFVKGLLYASNGLVVDPERSRVLGLFHDPWMVGYPSAVAPDVPTGRVYIATSSGFLVFDSNTYALLV